MTYLVGASPADTVLSGTTKEGKGFGLGDRLTTHDGKEYVWLRASAAITGAGYACFVTTANLATMLSTSNDARGNLVAIAPAALATGDEGWFQIGGFSSVRVLASCAANARLNTTATAGAFDDDATTGAMAIDGIALSTANGGAEGTVAAILNYPQIGVTI